MRALTRFIEREAQGWLVDGHLVKHQPEVKHREGKYFFKSYLLFNQAVGYIRNIINFV